MPYVPKFKTLFKILLRRRDPRTAEGLWFEGTWLSEQGDDAGARQAFLHARLLDPGFGGAFYNYAAITEKLTGRSTETLKAWQAYLAMAERDKRQHPEVIAKVRKHVADMEAAGKSK